MFLQKMLNLKVYKDVQWGIIYRKTADEFISTWSLYPAVCLLVGKKVRFKTCFWMRWVLMLDGCWEEVCSRSHSAPKSIASSRSVTSAHSGATSVSSVSHLSTRSSNWDVSSSYGKATETSVDVEGWLKSVDPSASAFYDEDDSQIGWEDKSA
jgi:hypothetical protein